MKRAISALLVAVLALAACGGGDSNDTAGDGSGGGGGTTSEPGTPQEGGVLKFAAYAEILGLDPVVAIGMGTSGGNQQGAIYDTIVRYDADTQEFENRTAESVTSNDDFTEWTVTLKPGIEFTDGTPYDAEAVKFGMDRHRSGLPDAPPCEELWACPSNNAPSIAYMRFISSIDVVDDLTLKFTLTQPWPTFRVALSLEAAMIPSPTALKKCDPTEPIKDCSFNVNPVGAGPFMVQSPMVAGEPLRLERNPDYWDGPVPLDGLEFVTASDAGGMQTLELLNSGAVDVAYLQDPTAIDQAKNSGLAGLSTLTQGGQALLFNIGAPIECVDGEPADVCAGESDGTTIDTRPITADVRLRQAIALAVDPTVVDQRATGGVGIPTNALFVEPFEWNPGLPGPELDLEKARALVEEVKADGWDGKLSFLTPATPFAEDVGIAIEAQLGAIGIDVTRDVRQGQGWQIAVTSTKDFEMTMWGLATTQDDSGAWQLLNALGTDEIGNRGGYSSEDMDAALADALVADTDEEKVAAYAAIQEQFEEDVPFVVYSVREEFRAFDESHVKGLISSHRYIVFFDKAWLE